MFPLRLSWILFLCLHISPLTSQPIFEKSLIWSSKTEASSGLRLGFIPGDPADLSRDNVTFRQMTFDATLATEANIHSVCSDHPAGTVYFAEFSMTAFFELDIESPTTRIVHQGIGDSLQMTVDWSSRNLYWVDGFFNWIAVKSLRKTDRFDYKVLVERDVDFPLGIAVDPTRGFLFWTEVGRVSLVKRARLDGDSPRVIAMGGLYQPIALTIDIETGRIYWVDKRKETVEYCGSDGSQRNVLRKVNSLKFDSIAYYQNLLFVTDQMENRVLVFRDGTGVLAKSYEIGAESLRDITVYAPENQPSLQDPCGTKNCEHFCVRSGPSSARCLCQTGFTLSPDDRSCTGSTVYSPRLISFANKTHVCFINITALSRGVPLTPHCPVTDGHDISAISPDSANRTVYYADRGRRRISSVSVRSGESRVVLSEVSNIQGLSYDWLLNTLYWTDSGTRQIKSYRLGSEAPPVTVLNSTDTLGPLALDPFSRQIFWISTSPLAIRSVSYDTPRSVKTLVSAGIRNPGDIHADPFKQRLYWSDGKEIKRVQTNGTGDTSVITTAHNNNKGLAVHKRLVFWTAHGSTANINSGNLYHKVHAQMVSLPSPEPLVDLDIVDSSYQEETRGACFENGGCDHYCLETGGATRECRCELGFDLQVDRKTCRTERLRTDHILVADLIAGRFYQVDLLTGLVRGMFHPKGASPTVALSPDKTLIYWSDLANREIVSSDRNGTGVKTFLSAGIHFADRLAVDPVTGNIFFSAVDARGINGSSYIGVVTPDGRSKKTLIPELNVPRVVVLHSVKGLVFWTDHGFGAHIGRANMDGSQRQQIITTDIMYPNGIAIDFDEDRLFWADGSRNVIERCTLFGFGREVIVRDVNAHLMAVGIHEENLYYTAWNKPGITVVKKADGSNKHLLMESAVFAELSDFVIVQPNKASSVTNTCSVDNGGCSSLCLPTPTARTCACPDRVQLGPDGRTCEGDIPRTTSRPQITATHPSSDPGNTEERSDNTVVIIASATSAGVIVVVGLVVVIVVVLIFQMRKKNNSRPAGTVVYNNGYAAGPNDPARGESFYCSIVEEDMMPVGSPPPYSAPYPSRPPNDPAYLTPSSSGLVKCNSPEEDHQEYVRPFRPPVPLPLSNGDTSGVVSH